MTARAVPAGNGVQWLTSAAQLVFKKPAAFLLMGAALGFPIIGGLAMIIFPVWFAGIMYAARKEDSGQKAEFPDLFQGFQQPGRVGPLLLLVLPGLALGIVLVILAFVFVGAALFAAGNQSGAGAAAGMGGIALVGLLALAGMFFVSLLMFFSISRVMFDGVDAFSAMKESLNACFKNIGGVILFFLVFFIPYVVAFMLLFWIPFIGQWIVATLFFPVLAVGYYQAYKDVFGLEQSMGSPLQAPEPPMPPRPPTVQ
jgi:hypothetical protein